MASNGFWENRLLIGTAGSALANSTTETSIMPSSQLTLYTPAGFFSRTQVALRFRLSGLISNIVTTPGTLTLKLYLDSVAMFSTGAMALNATAKTAVTWCLDGELICQAIGGGTATQLMPNGCGFQSESYVGSAAATAGGSGRILLPYNTSQALGSGFDNGPSHLFDVKATWSIANAGNSIQLLAGSVDLPV